MSKLQHVFDILSIYCSFCIVGQTMLRYHLPTIFTFSPICLPFYTFRAKTDVLLRLDILHYSVYSTRPKVWYAKDKSESGSRSAPIEITKRQRFTLQSPNTHDF